MGGMGSSFREKAKFAVAQVWYGDTKDRGVTLGSVSGRGRGGNVTGGEKVPVIGGGFATNKEHEG